MGITIEILPTLKMLIKYCLIYLKKKKLNSFSTINICSNKPVNILKLIKFFEKKSKKIKIHKRPIQQADVLKTHGDNSLVKKYKLIKKFTDIESGVNNTLHWYKKYYKY